MLNEKSVLLYEIGGHKIKKVFNKYNQAEMYADMLGLTSYNIYNTFETEDEMIKRKMEKREENIDKLLNDSLSLSE
jgi:hypothetical protein